ncbi:MAG: 3',5'-cyclic-nucleotide phosphodiesterase [Betaproteobacteria bacterium HGW-Betaproteobacteria-13]|nr:MAG: 3',5'-cyclic-nucleotide phosphodiesterase [Betaproteobacteria bacterium HGW-Betaproteobacteria-13]
MKLQVLGCSGGIGGETARTTAFLVDDDILVDCGTGVGDLELDALRKIDHIFITHSHLDHIASIPLLVDSVGEERGYPITVYATPETLRILRSHIFNWLIWPDFTSIPDRHRPFLRHTVPAVAYALDSGDAQLLYSGDTAYCPELIEAINALPALRHMIIETAFSDEQRGLAMASRHLCPSMLVAMLEELSVSPEVFISHLKPGQGGRIMAQIEAGQGRLQPKPLVQGQILEF